MMGLESGLYAVGNPDMLKATINPAQRTDLGLTLKGSALLTDRAMYRARAGGGMTFVP